MHEGSFQTAAELYNFEQGEYFLILRIKWKWVIVWISLSLHIVVEWLTDKERKIKNKQKEGDKETDIQTSKRGRLLYKVFIRS